MQQTSGSMTRHAPVAQVTVIPRFAHRFDDVPQALHAALERAQLNVVPNAFRVNAGRDLFELYLEQFDPQDRQYHNCNCCRSFIGRYGSLVTLTSDGKTKSVLWDETLLGSRHPYRKVIKALREAVERGHVVDQFFWDGKGDWGVREQGGFTHLWTSPGVVSHSSTLKNADQLAAEQRENRRHLHRALSEFTLGDLERARDLLLTGGLNQGDKTAKMAEFLIEAKRSMAHISGGEAVNRRLWFRVAMAAKGWCTPRSSVLGALIDDIRSGASVESIRRNHNKRADPLTYQRAQAAPTAGNVARAERLFEQMGLARSLERRPARADEVVFDWTPQVTDAPQSSGGIFSHLLAQDRLKTERALLNVQAERITYARFARDVLPRALEIEAVVPHQGNFCAITTAVHPDAPPILQWDSLECRNPFAWYVYHQGSPASNWGLRSGRVKVVGVTKQPSQWNGDRFSHHGRSVIFLLEGAADQRNASLALFPECLRGELHEVRATLEAHSRSTKLARLRPGVQHAAGLRVDDRTPLEVLVRTSGGVARYQLDRMD
ncbi:hypothetical protein P9A54_gp06 [Xanthomonas phage vB_Xar_IVIA-DoCa10]|uniref:Uncharacterized protein n=1 Tax=Xanthomonas phage vB_Xar_IVIA-DoCa10 TaxID=2975529 RepID=A0A9X9NZ65_9CAUD|nr:hypothetical protein P9A54_gp06 [Xanthomonas phage vB_Xar_IVIA-DoCa10]UYA98991.1 hypothetical protein IVIADoCa10_6 [Xanthomonas phage vB_Xar_IVIA-DoCa10]